jgi:hypothetical protein
VLAKMLTQSLLTASTWQVFIVSSTTWFAHWPCSKKIVLSSKTSMCSAPVRML